MWSGRSPSTGNVVLGVILLVVGGAFLLGNADLVDIDRNVLWPALAIVVGIVVLGAAFLRPGRPAEATSVLVPMDGATGLELTMRVGAGRYRLQGGSSALVEVTADQPTVAHRVERLADRTRVRLSTAVEQWVWAMRGGTGWDVRVASDLPVTLDVQAGAGDLDFDLSSVGVRSAVFVIGAADLRVTLPRPRGDVPIRADGGASSFTFRVPEGVEARVASTGLVTRSGPAETPGYARAVDRVTVTVTGGAASVRLVPAA